MNRDLDLFHDLPKNFLNSLPVLIAATTELLKLKEEKKKTLQKRGKKGTQEKGCFSFVFCVCIVLGGEPSRIVFPLINHKPS